MRYALYDCAARDDHLGNEGSCKESVDNGALFVGGTSSLERDAFASRERLHTCGRTRDDGLVRIVWCSVEASFWRLVRCVAAEC